MRRFFTSPENITEKEVVLRGSDVSHIRTVLRMKTGDRVHVLDGRGHRYTVCLEHVRPKEIVGRIEGMDRIQTESPVDIRMGMALLKGNRFDSVLRQAVELGVNAMVPLWTDRCMIRILRTEEVKKTERWGKIAREAAKQCGRTKIPEVHSRILSLKEFCEKFHNVDLKLIFWESEEKNKLEQICPPQPPESITVLTGPEGGFSENEIRIASDYGFRPLSLGPRILRAETAPIAVLSILQYRWGDL